MKNKTQHRTRRIGFTFTKANVSVSLMSLVWCLNSINRCFTLSINTRKRSNSNRKSTNTKPSMTAQKRRLGPIRAGRVTVEVHYLFGCLLLFHTIPNYNIYYFPAKPLHYALKATLFACKNTNKQGEEGGSHGQRGHSSGAVCLPGWLHALHPSHRQSQHM